MDRELVLRAQRGEEAAFAALALRCGDRLHAVAHHILRDADLAADAAQLAMIEIWRKLPQLRDADAFMGWAYRIVVRAANDEAKRRSRIRVAPPSVYLETSIAPDSGHEVADRDQLERAFGHLRLEHRTAIVLKHYAGLSNAEIASVLEVPEGTVRSRLFHGMQALRAALAADARVPEAGR